MNSNVNQILAEVHKVIVGKDDVMEKILMTLISRGHVLLDDVPGTGKTTAALAFHRALGLRYGRIQFTPDVLPSDIVGFSIYRKESGTFVYQPGAVMTNLLLADEINRTSSKTQAALLEVMEERQVTVDGVTYPLARPFMVLATQNPVDFVGTYPLPEAQMDRFFMRVSIGYPSLQDEIDILGRYCGEQKPMESVVPVCSAEDVIAMQQEWRTIGFAPQKMNVKIFERFRIANDEFFNKKAEFFKGLKDTYSTNLEKKQQLVNKAKELADSTDWKKTGDKLIALQKEWKKVGTVPHKQGELLWKEFLDTCNKFFEARNKQNAGSRSEEHANLDKKRSIIAQLKELVVAEITDNDFQKKLKDLAKQYSTIGHVPFKEKDKVYKEYHEAIDAAYEKLHATNAKRHFDNFKNNLKNVAKEGGNALGNERGKLLRRYDQLRNEITTYENNLGFFNTASKKGNNLVEEMNRKIEKLKADLEMVKQKIKAIDAEKK